MKFSIPNHVYSCHRDFQSGLELGVPLGVKLEMSLIVAVVTLLVVLGQPAVSGVDIIARVVSVSPSTVYKQSITIVRTYVHPQCLHCMLRTLLG